MKTFIVISKDKVCWMVLISSINKLNYFLISDMYQEHCSKMCEGKPTSILKSLRHVIDNLDGRSTAFFEEDHNWYNTQDL